MNAVINIFVILAVVVMQIDRLFVSYKVTDLMQDENADIYKHNKGPYSLLKKKHLVLNSIWFAKKDRDKITPECKRLFLRQRIDLLVSLFFVVLWVIFILAINF